MRDTLYFLLEIPIILPNSKQSIHHGPQVAEDLLEAGSSPDTTEHSRGLSLLMMAGEEGNTAMVELLLAGGANTRYITALGDTAVTVAQARGHDNVARQENIWLNNEKKIAVKNKFDYNIEFFQSKSSIYSFKSLKMAFTRICVL